MLPFKIDLTDKVVVVTGGGGVLCSTFSEALAECGAKVAVLDLRKEAADKVAEAINNKGGQAAGFAADVLNIDSLKDVKKQINEALGTVDILINGAGGNHPKGTTTKEYLYKEDLEKNEDIITFFDLDPKGVEFTFNLNFIGT